jgi:hypothetical protein
LLYRIKEDINRTAEKTVYKVRHLVNRLHFSIKDDIIRAADKNISTMVNNLGLLLYFIKEAMTPLKQFQWCH